MPHRKKVIMFIYLPDSNRLLNTDHITVARWTKHAGSPSTGVMASLLTVKLSDGTEELFRENAEQQQLWAFLQTLAEQQIPPRQE